ncbi:hypothetical protein HAX54_003639, partial [Datura stramonium]|nr:hypothetical protein [Datura stramonium]
TAFIRCYIGSLQIEIDDSLLCLRLNICYPSFSFLIGNSVAVHGYPDVIRCCFTDAASVLNVNSSSLFLL